MTKNYILITGATSGIGLACAEKFASQGNNLILTGRRNDRLLTIQERLKSEFSIDVVISCFDIQNKEAYPQGNMYCATKHAVDALTKAMRQDLLPHNIKVTGIHPGAAETEFSLVRFKGDQSKADAVYKGFEPLHPEDIADIIYYTTTLPANVCINELIVTPTAQANSYLINKLN